MKRILFLYTELADYTVFALESLSKDAQVFVVHYNVNSDAPFQLNVSEHITSKARNTFTASSLLKWIQDINPDLLICSGWTDRKYITAVRRWNNPQRCVLTMDTVWNGHPRQWLACVISRFTICRWFSKLWVPGELQKKYAQKLGFTTIATGFYCCRHTLFLPLAQKRFINSKKNKKILLYVGRYDAQKGISRLWNEFTDLHHQGAQNWELWCAGTGPVYPLQHPAVKHFGFVQPERLLNFILEADAFILPSTFEPWGVVVHEMACSGLPLILSSAVGAAERFLISEKNGFIFESNAAHSLKQALTKLFKLEPNMLYHMGQKSHELAQQITINQWMNTLKLWMA